MENWRRDDGRASATGASLATAHLLPATTASDSEAVSGQQLTRTTSGGERHRLLPVAGHAQQQPLRCVGAADRDSVPQEAFATPRAVRHAGPLTQATWNGNDAGHKAASCTAERTHSWA